MDMWKNENIGCGYVNDGILSHSGQSILTVYVAYACETMQQVPYVLKTC